MAGIIYKYTNKVNGKIYIGQTFYERSRRNEHKRHRDIKTSAFDRAVQKYGFDNFEYEVLFKIENSERAVAKKILDEKEKYYIEFFHSHVSGNGYNITRGGGGMYGYSRSEETKNKIRNKLLGGHLSIETRIKLSHVQKRRSHEVREVAAQKVMKPIEQYTKEGVFVKRWSSQKEIKQTLGFYHADISKVCNGKRKSAYGYVWKFVNEENIKSKIPKIKSNMEYIEFLRSKMAVSIESGFKVSDDELTPSLFPHVRDTVKWAVSGGQRAIFSSFGMQKTVTQLEILRLIVAHEGGKGLVVCPRRVVVEFVTQAKEWLNMNVVYVRTMQEVEANLDNCDVFITNYERVRDGEDGVRIDPNYFIATSLDEASVLRQFDTKTYQTFLPRFANVKYKFVATATPSPNRYDEMVQYAGYLGVMDTNQAIQRFFKRDQTKNNNLTLYPHKQEEFWLWVSTWALFITKPSDLGYSDEGYELPKLTVIEEVVGVDNDSAGYDDDGQKRMFRDAAIGLQAAAKERRDSMPAKIQRVVEIINRPENINDHFLLWHDLEAERMALCKAIDGCKAVYGSQNDDEADKNVLDFKEGRLKYLAAKPEMLGEGLNFQHHCHKAIMFIDYRFNDKFQAIARIHRFMQKHEVTLYLVYAESEQEIYKTFMQKWKRHNEMVGKMADLLRKNGLFGTDMIKRLERYMFSQREEQSGKLWRSINNDNCLELPNMEDNSIGLIVTSIPFSNQYEYTSAYNDFGFNENNDKFFEQMDFLTPHLLRVLQPGRIACIHVKDRVLSGYKGGTCFQTIVPFSDLSVLHYIKHGFKYCGRITVDTDVVQENNKSYRLGYTEMCKDGTKMSVGCPEYILIFRKEPSDTKDAYADIPVVKSKDEYSLARWQIDAHAHWSDSGDRLLSYDDIKNMDLDGIRAYYRKFAKEHLYNYEEHVAFSETLGAAGRLSKESFVLAPVSHKDYIWDLGDYRRTDTLNTRQAKADKQVHICPLPMDLVKRCIERWSNKDEWVLDPYGGIGTVPYCAIKLGRKGSAIELNWEYWRDGLTYLREAEMDKLSPTLFDFMEEQAK